MTGCITFEDGSDHWFSNLGLAGFQDALAEVVESQDIQMASWLVDMSKRHSVQDIDLRGLDSNRRRLFWRGVDILYRRKIDWDQSDIFSPRVEVIRQIYALRDVQHLPIKGDDIEVMDLAERWFSED